MNHKRLAVVSLTAVAAMWGVAFVVMKPAIAEQPFYDFLATRFTIATVIMVLVRPRVFQAIDRKTLVRGAILGVILGLAYVTQTIALEMTTAAITGFLTGLYVVITPILGWLLFRRRVGAKVAIAAILAMVGLGLIAITGFSIEIAQTWGIICAVLYAAHIVGLGRWSAGLDAYALTVVQLAAVTVVCWIGALPNGYQAPPTGDVWFAVLFTAVFATAIGFFVQTWAQARLEPSRVAIILTLEVVFTAVISVAAGQEVLGLKTIIGGAIMIAAMLLVEWPSRNKTQLVPIEPMAH
ncbi:MAG: DMT family transporter [Actinomycetales bacterium]|nr:DMT family transporter [Actinomycetales bacterium]